MAVGEAARQEPTVVGRYAIFDRIGVGGMATVHLGRLLGGAGFARTVAIKRLHAQFALDPEFVAMFVDEGKLASRIRHPNVVATFDVVAEENELFMVMEYVEGEALSPLVRAANKRKERVPPAIASAIIIDVLHGLHAAHTAHSEQGQPLGIVHRDISPQNVIVGADGGARVLDFGVAKAMGRAHTTNEGRLKGKLGYMSPEHIAGEEVSPRSDVFGTAIVLWELLVGRHLFRGDGEAALIKAVQSQTIPPPSTIVADLPKALEAVVMRGLDRDPEKRYASAAEMADALEAAVPPASRRAVGDWVQSLVGETLAARRRLVAAVESVSTGDGAGAFSVHSRVREKPGAAAARRVAADSVTLEATTMIRPRMTTRIRIVAGAASLTVLSVIALILWLALRTSPEPEVIAPATAAPADTFGSDQAAGPTKPDPPASEEVIDVDPPTTPLRRTAPPTSRPKPTSKPKDGSPKGSIYSRE